MGMFSKASEWVEDDRKEQEAIAAKNVAEIEARAAQMTGSELSADGFQAEPQPEDAQQDAVVTIDAQLKLIARKVKAAHKRIQKASEQAVLGVLEMGEQLRIASQLLANHKNGSFGKWLKSCGIPRTSAHRSIKVFETLGACSTVGQLDLGAAYALAASGTPEAAIAEVLTITTEQRVDAKQVRAIVSKHKPRNQQVAPDPILIRVGGATISIVSAGRTDWAAILLEAAEQLDREQAAA